MKELFVIYNKNTGFIDGGAGRIDRQWDNFHKDGSTMSERIPKILAKNPKNYSNSSRFSPTSINIS